MYNCKPYKGSVNDKSINEITGIWYQTSAVLFNDSIHMVGPNKWNFKNNKCQILLSNPKEYRYQITNDYLELYPIDGNEYQEWENVLFFGKKIILKQNDTVMKWSILDTLQINFRRNL